MNKNIKKIILIFISIIAFPFKVIPESIRRNILFSLLVIESRVCNPKKTLKNLFLLKDKLEILINERALRYGEGEHPKHKLMKYHDYFINNIPNDSSVLDIGCGYGIVARSIAEKVKGVVVTGIDNDRDRLNQAKSNNHFKNLSFIFENNLKTKNNKKYDVLVMSNILEHVEKRVDFIKKIVQSVSAEIILIRVPLFERHWELPMRKELGVNYFSDSTHFIEHTKEEFKKEISDAGLRIDNMQILWGEIWAKCITK